MADHGAPTYPVIRVAHIHSDVDPNEYGMVSRLDEATGQTVIEDAEKYWYGPAK